MSHLLERLTFFTRRRESFAGGHGVSAEESREWEESYRARWQHDKIVRSTHGVNCTGSCSWKIYVKGGIITWETQQTDYPRTRADLPNHEPRGCSRGASYSWYIYSANRLKYPLARKRLLRLWREARKTMAPVEAWASIVEDPAKAAEYKRARGRGGFVRADWEEVAEIAAAANIYTIKKFGPDRVAGFSPIPAMSMVSYAAGTRYLSLIGGVCMSFYDWYCDLPPASPQTWGEQTDVPESADWYNAGFLMLWGSNVPQTRTPDAHFYTEARYKGTKSVVITPDYSEAAKFADMWISPKQGTDAALALAMGHVILREFHLDKPCAYFGEYCRQNSDLPFLVRLTPRGEHYAADRLLRAADFADDLGEANNPQWKPVAVDENSDRPVAPRGSIGFRWGEKGKWNLEEKDGGGDAIKPRLSLLGEGADTVTVDFPYFGAGGTEAAKIISRPVAARRLRLKNGEEVIAATVFDLLLANYGLERGLGGGASSYDDDAPYTPAWQEKITGVPRAKVIAAARAFAENAAKTRGRSMVIVGAGLNHWYQMDMIYRAIIQMLVLCGCVGVSGGGWSHYVGQEKLRPQTGWQPLAFALDWARPPRQVNSTSFWYAHTDQWRYEKIAAADLLSPTAAAEEWRGSLIDFNVRAERMGWLPSAPHFNRNPLTLAKEARAAGQSAADYIVAQLKSGDLRFACEDPDDPANHPRNLFVWRANLLGSSGKGHEYFLKHLLGASHGVQGEDIAAVGGDKPLEVKWREPAPEGKLDLLCTLDFRMSTTCLYSDLVLPTATWYEKNDLNTSDMHPFIHPLCKAADPVWECRSDWEIYKTIARKFAEIAPAHLGKEEDIVAAPILHDTPAELAQPLEVAEWKRGQCEMLPGKTMPALAVVARDYPAVYRRFTALGPLLAKIGNGGKGLTWETGKETAALAARNGKCGGGGETAELAKIETDIQAAEAILALAPETNGEVALRAWESLSQFTGRDHRELAKGREHDKIQFHDLQAQPRKIISSPIWSGVEDEHVTYTAGYTNITQRIPWRTLTGRQQLYQDHPWMRAFGEQLCVYKPPIDTKSIGEMMAARCGKHPQIALNFITPHQKWGIHSTYTDNLLMLTLSRGGPIVWLSEDDAARADIADNDWVELYNANGALVARAVVSQRVKPGMAMMYHAQEKIVNTPGSEITGNRGGIHNSVTRVAPKPTHMIGGYAQQSYGFNYYGTVGSNRDEFVVVRKMDKVDWLDGEEGSVIRQ